MTESLLQYIWQMQYFNRGSLVTTNGEPVEIISQGIVNINQGPDFSDARIRIGSTTWAGTVELHLHTSGWYKHGHGDDRNFQNVILHVVWENDLQEYPLPLLELKDRVPKFLLQRYDELMRVPFFIPCEKMIGQTDPLIFDHWIEHLLEERLRRKAESICTMLDQCRHNWQELFWWLLARNFGHSVNAEAFEAMARTLSIKLISKHAGQIHQLEALLLGQAGLLNGNYQESYPTMLKREYQFLKNKYDLSPVMQPVHFLRMRPANFPTIRLAQLAMLLHTNGHLLAHIKDEEQVLKLWKLFDINANDYWLTHYLFDRPSDHRQKNIGISMITNILVNTLVPFIYAYGSYHKNETYKQRAIQWLSETGAETNSLLSGFAQAGIRIGDAAGSQALIELKKQYCDSRRCLDCNIGNAILATRL